MNAPEKTNQTGKGQGADKEQPMTAQSGPRKEIGEYLRWARKEICWSQEKLAAMAGVSEGTVKNAEAGNPIEDENFWCLKTAIEDEWESPKAKTKRPALEWPSKTLSAQWWDYLRDTPGAQAALDQYLRKYTERYGQVRLLGMSEPIPLKKIYTAVQMVDPSVLKRWKTTTELEKAFRTSSSRDFLPRDTSRKDGLKLANKTQFLNILGQPGAGKSTFMRRMGLEALLPVQERKYDHACVPVFVELKRFKVQQHLHLSQLIRQELAMFGFPESFSHVALKQGKLLILLDGLDEVPTESLESVIEEIKEFVNEHSSNRFITSCRTAFYKTWFPRFTDVVLADFDDEQIQTFLRNWFSKSQDRELETADKIWQMLRRTENDATRELARTPLLLTFICLVFDASQNLPANRSDLYEEALKILLEKWAAEKRIRRDSICRGLTTKWEIILLEQIAGPAFEEDRIFFTEKQLVNEIDRFLRKDLNAPQNLEGQEVLEAIEVQQGLLVKRAHNIYSFSHLTLQEYLAARYFFNTGKTDDLIARFLFDRRWREVFLLLVGIGRADNVLIKIAQTIAERINEHQKLSGLLRWVRKNYVAPKFVERAAAKRAAVLFLVLALDPYADAKTEAGGFLDSILNCAIHIDAALDLNEAFVNLHPLVSSNKSPVTRAFALDLVKRLRRSGLLKEGLLDAADARLQSFSYRLTYDQYNAYEKLTTETGQIKGILISSFGVPYELMHWTKDEMKSLEPIFYTLQFLIECKESALSVDSEVWRDIVKSLLTAENSEPKQGGVQPIANSG